jgi:hypothetical protein
MKYLFLDDERVPADVTWVNIGDPIKNGTQWNIVRSYDDAIEWVIKNGFPDVISFDHDLGIHHYAGNYTDGKTGYDFAKWLIEHDMNTDTMPEYFAYRVHSKNPVGAKNIQTILDNYLKFKKGI